MPESNERAQQNKLIVRSFEDDDEEWTILSGPRIGQAFVRHDIQQATTHLLQSEMNSR